MTCKVSLDSSIIIEGLWEGADFSLEAIKAANADLAAQNYGPALMNFEK